MAPEIEIKLNIKKTPTWPPNQIKCGETITWSQYRTPRSPQNYGCFVPSTGTKSSNAAQRAKSQYSYASQTYPANAPASPKHSLARPNKLQITKNHRPKLPSKRAMKKKMTYRLPPLLHIQHKSNTNTCLTQEAFI